MTPAFVLTGRALLAMLPLALAACAAPQAMPPLPASAPERWSAPLPHGGQTQALADWWGEWNDPVLPRLIEQAQALSPGLASAQARLVEARTQRVEAAAKLLPLISGNASVSRGYSTALGSVATIASAGPQLSWEADLFGMNRAALAASEARLQGARAQWHEARVSVAAEVASQYVQWRQCGAQARLAAADARSREASADWLGQATRAGLQSASTLSLAQASAAEGRQRWRQQQTQCEVQVRALVALTGQTPGFFDSLQDNEPPAPPDALFSLDSLPARVLEQRPDVVQATRQLAANWAEVQQADAAGYPQLSLQGSVSALRLDARGSTQHLSTWSLGPLSLSFPITDGGRLKAERQAAQARYTEAVALYQARVRQAVREVEEALLNLASAQQRQHDAQQASEGYERVLQHTQTRQRAGLASLAEVEEARRSALAAQTSLSTLALERQLAWINLYRAAGGGWDGNTAAPEATSNVTSKATTATTPDATTDITQEAAAPAGTARPGPAL
ncbi:efflux transporter outer membrane subunit [Curvibacter lanceolatus]|uniref:efflux transporter outer membrane subunit n=1 Tax=Curvibacter lanceolatus TaxID=86182 RepID=UPI0003656957|nr:efflux transporter outer membrane subunit [Curvibacter lanceolatus]